MSSADKPRVRFAPSPTGELHVGNARTALFNWLFARHFGGTFLLRIEDTDRERTKDSFIAHLMEDLLWLGLDWDEGPTRSGEFGPYRQSERLTIYGRHLEVLRGQGLVYPCYCTEEELEAERRSLIAKKVMPRYMGKCRDLTAAQRREMEAAGRVPAFRFRVPGGEIEFADLIRGTVKFRAEAIGDFIVVRSNGIPAYNFAAVIDDHLMEITHVIRGEDHLTNTALQLLLYRAFGFASPAFAHHSLILGKDRTKLSKRHGSVTVREFRNLGFLPEAMVNYLSLLGGSLGEGREVMPLADIVASFSLERAGKSGAIFDEDKLRWLNSLYIKQDDPTRLTSRLIPYLETAGCDCKSIGRERLERIVDVVRENLTTLSDAEGYLGLFTDEKYSLSAEARPWLAEEQALPVLETFLEMIRSQELAAGQDYGRVMKALQTRTNVKGKKLFMIIRAALTGRTSGPELEKIVGLLEKRSLILRLENAVSLAKALSPGED